MTKVILVGGYRRKAPDGGKAVATEIVAGFAEPVKLLLCYFARPRIEWEVLMLEDRLFFAGHVPDKHIEYRIAKVDSFVDDVRWADSVYLAGGDTHVLLERLAECPGWEKELEGKTIAGSSAGAMALAKYWYDIDTFVCGEGYGLVPIKVQTHYRSDYNAPNVDWDKADRELKAYKEDLPVLNLAEGQFEVVTC